jgi:steroid delta-isomerase
MFTQLDHPTFLIRQTLVKDLDVALLWDFRFSLKRWNKNPQCFEGVSWLRFNQDFLVEKHQDFWDPAEGIYEKLPFIGPIMRGLKRSA